VLAGANQQSQSVAGNESRHEGTRHETTGAGDETDGGHWFTVAGKVEQLNGAANVAANVASNVAMCVAFAIGYR
jgi:hypothetical protein